MFNEIIEFLKDGIERIDENITLDNAAVYEDKKLEIVLSTDVYMASISILADYTYDFLAVEIESENVVMNKTKNCGSLEELKSEIDRDVSEFAGL